MGLADMMGSLEPGKRADLVIRSGDLPEYQPGHYPIQNLLLASRGKSVDTVIVDGQIVVRGGHSTRVDEQVVYERETKCPQARPRDRHDRHVPLAHRARHGDGWSGRAMTPTLEGRVAIITGAGRGLGRAHALHLASQGARVLVNDPGGDVHGRGTDITPAQRVVNEIAAAGGEAAVSGHDVSDWTQACQMIAQAIESFGGLDVLVNNAGILRDRTIANMTEDEWDVSSECT
jgi:hypothetical protein